ncbi:hypothetical protein LK533_15385 [Sphingomonas sp. PL-96]|uniref:hypothetical protein n=1 Tax=Sphingomonas sp. PL-96 TaxID=2887201 RepID=UPI001E4D4F61|nr:hypothetical protein [Sphingomonas sp. PL-96]MCC2978047.1 hypothetical protein [Sphingomonas sp. PL-96]
MRRLMPVVACVMLVACSGQQGATVIDGSSQEAFERTLSAAKKDVGPRDRLKVEAAIAEYRARTFAKANDRAEFQRLYRQGLDGLTTPAIAAQFDKDTERVGNKAADAIFDAKRALSGS